MDDSIFVAGINWFFCENQKSTMESKPTQADKASYFLDNVMKIGLKMYFLKLLQAMEKYGGPVEQLAIEIKEKIEKSK